MYEKTRFITYDVGGLYETIEVVEGVDTVDTLIAEVPSEVVRRERDRILLRISLSDRHFYMKVWWASGYVRLVKDLSRGGKAAAREARGMLLLNDHGLLTPRLMAYGSVFHTRTSGFSYHITEEISGAETLKASMERDSSLLSEEVIGRTLSQLHSNNLIHEDLHPENLLISEGDVESLYFVDCMGVGRPRFSISILDDLANFFYWAERIGWPAPFRDGILRAYGDAWPSGGKGFEGLRAAVATCVAKRKSRFSPYQLRRRIPF